MIEMFEFNAFIPDLKKFSNKRIMETGFNIATLIISILLIITVLLQANGAGLSETFGGNGTMYKTKRGTEKTLFYATIIFTSLLAILSVLNILFIG